MSLFTLHNQSNLLFRLTRPILTAGVGEPEKNSTLELLEHN